jgi:hypothetical protein
VVRTGEGLQRRNSQVTPELRQHGPFVMEQFQTNNTGGIGARSRLSNPEKLVMKGHAYRTNDPGNWPPDCPPAGTSLWMRLQ